MMDSLQWITISVIVMVNSVYSQIPLHGSESLHVDPILKDTMIKLPVVELIPENAKNLTKPLDIKLTPHSIVKENINIYMEEGNEEKTVHAETLGFNKSFNQGVVTEIGVTEKSNINEQYHKEGLRSDDIMYTEATNEELVTEPNVSEIKRNNELTNALEQHSEESIMPKDEQIYTKSNNEELATEVEFIEELNNKVMKNNLTGETHVENPDADVEDFVNSWKLGIPEDMVFTKAFVASLLVIIVSELGDKTFFIAAIMAMNHPRIIVFLGSMLALGSMHVIASLFGFAIAYIPRLYTFYASSALFIFFGLKMLWEAWRMKPEDSQEELEEVTSDLKRRSEQQQRRHSESGVQDLNIDQENQENNNNQASDVSYQNQAFEFNEASNNDAVVTIQESETANNFETVKYFKGYTEDDNTAERPGFQEVTLTHRSRDNETNTVIRRQVERSNVGQDNAEESNGTQAEGATNVLSLLRVMMTHPFFQAFSMTFLAEWGDRSQIATVIMASTEDVWGIIVGGGLGHFLCTGLAVIGGQLIATKISVRTVTFIGGIVFLLFAIVGLVMGPD